MRVVAAAVFAILALVCPPATMGVPFPVMTVAEDGGSAGTSCRWNPYSQLQCTNVCWWVGRFEWYTPSGLPTGQPCA